MLHEAGERVRHAQADHEQARRESLRMEKLATGGFVSRQDAEQTRVSETTSANELEGARFRLRSTEADLNAARAALLALDTARAGRARIPVRSPVVGKVLRIPERSERVEPPAPAHHHRRSSAPRNRHRLALNRRR
jgi:multidrug resistance efflux pump